MEPDEASTSTTGPAPMNRLPDGPRSRAEAGEHALPVDADPDEAGLDESRPDEPGPDEPRPDEASPGEGRTSGSGSPG